jgi:hypothetical protein
MMLRPIERRRWLVVAATALAVAAAACGGSASGAIATGGTAGGSSAAGGSARATASSGPDGGATPTTGAPGGSSTGSTAPSPIEATAGVVPAVDPCQLVPAGDASALAGTSFSAGVEQAEQQAKQCVYGSQTRNVLTVSVIQAASTAQAQAGKEQFLAALRRQADNQLHVTQVPNLADGAVLAKAAGTIQGTRLAISSIAVLEGTAAFGISDLVVGGDPASDGALLHEAKVVLARLP